MGVVFSPGRRSGGGGTLFSFYSGCQDNVPIGERYFVTTTYAAILFFGTFL
jgi:hypothetical protein